MSWLGVFWISYITALFGNLQYSMSRKNPPDFFLTSFPERLGIFSPNFTHLFLVPTYAGLQIFIQLSATLTKLCHINCDHHYMLKMSTIG